MSGAAKNKTIDGEEVRRRLRAEPGGEPPAELLPRLLEEIPPELTVREGGLDGRPRALSRRRVALLAASLALTLGAGLVALRVARDSGTAPAAREASRPAPSPSAGVPATPEPEVAEAPPKILEKSASSPEDRQASQEAAPPAGEPTPGPALSPAAGDTVAGGRVAAAPQGPTSILEDKLVVQGRKPSKPSTSSASGTVVEEPAARPAPESVPAYRIEGRKVARRNVELQKLQREQRQLQTELKALGYAGSGSVPAAPPARRVESGILDRAPRVAPSTGGTAEPNDQPYGDVFFRAYGTNPFVDTEDDRLSTFALDVDTGSYTVVRRYLEDGHLPPPEAVRVEELINYFDYGDASPSEGDFALVAQGSPSPFGEGPRYALLRFHVQARAVAEAERKPAVLTFVVDVSGSMARENRLELVKRALFLLLDRLHDDDRVGLVVYGDRGRVLLEPSGDRAAIRSAIDHLRPGGSTNAEEGLVLGYQLAGRFFRRGAINRVILCTDGVANVGRTGPESILERIGAAARRGVELTALGFGMGNFNDVLLEQLADRGDGRYAYVDSLAEARRVLVETLTGTLETVARDAKAQVEFDPGTVERYRLVGYENRDVADQRFRDDTVDAGEVGAGQGVTALYEIKLAPRVEPGARLATLRLRYRSVATGEVVEVAREIRRGGLAATWDAAPRELRLTSLVAEMGEILKHTYWAKNGNLDEVFRRAQKVVVEGYPGDEKKAELVSLMGRAAALRREAAPGSE